jgi:hypothetical protein
MSLFDRQGIPERLVRDRVEIQSFQNVKLKNQQRIRARGLRQLTRLFHRKGDYCEGYGRDEKKNGVGNEFEDDLLVLRNYAFISVSKMLSGFEMHALVQLAMRKWLEAKGDLKIWRRHYFKILSNEFPTGEYENWARCQELFPHAQSAAAQKPEEQESLTDWASVLYNAAWYAWRMGKGMDAENMAVHTMKVRKRILGNEHNDTLSSMAMVALTYNMNGRLDDAEKLGLQVMETIKTKLGVDHPDTLMSMNNLAFTWKGTGKEIEAVELMEDCVRVQKRVLGVNHPHSISSCTALDAWKAEQDVILSIQRPTDG